MIQSFKDRDTEALFNRESHKRFREFERVALRELRLLNRTVNLQDLSLPPGNRLEALEGDRAGTHSIRINQQWRICFRWENGDAFDVEIVDYH